MNLTAPELEKIITLLFTQALLFGGGLLTTYFKLKSSAAKREESIKESIASKVEEMKLHQDMSMQKLNGMLTYLIHSFGRPAWLKVARMSPCGEIEFRMLEVNDDYAATFGISRLAYIGKTDLEISMIMSRSRATVRFHIHNASMKLNAVNRSQTVFKAAQLGYISLAT